MSEQAIVRLLPVFSAAAGCVDAVCVMRFGGPFASVITGNLVHLGRAVATLDGPLAANAAAAVASFALGVAGASLGLREGRPGWRRRTTVIVATEVLLLVCVAAGWLATGGQPDASVTTLLLTLSAAAMGVQSAATMSLGVRGASTTYLTGTLTGLVRTLATEPHRVATTATGASRLAGLLGGAALGALLVEVAPLWAPVLPVVLVGASAVIAAASAGGRARTREDPPAG